MAKKSFKDKIKKENIHSVNNVVDSDFTKNNSNKIATNNINDVQILNTSQKNNEVPQFVEVKSKRVQLLMQPSVYEKIQNIAKKEKQSINNLINITLQNILETTEQNNKIEIATQFLSNEDKSINIIPKGFKVNPELFEAKSRKVQLLIQPILYKQIKNIADTECQSFNSYVHKVLEILI